MAKAGEVVNTFFNRIANTLAKGDRVELRAFGSFNLRLRNTKDTKAEIQKQVKFSR